MTTSLHTRARSGASRILMTLGGALAITAGALMPAQAAGLAVPPEASKAESQMAEQVYWRCFRLGFFEKCTWVRSHRPNYFYFHRRGGRRWH